MKKLIALTVTSLWSLSPYRVVIVVVAAVVAAGATVLVPVLLGYGVAAALAAPAIDSALHTLMFTICIYALVWFVSVSASQITLPMLGWLDHKLLSKMMVEGLQEALVSKNPARYLQNDTELSYAVESRSNAVREVNSTLMWGLLPASCNFVIATIILGVTASPATATIFVATIVVYGVCSKRLIAKHQAAMAEMYAKSLKSFGVLGNGISLWREARVLRQEIYLLARYREDRKIVDDSGIKAYKAARKLYLVQALVLALGLLVMLTLNLMLQPPELQVVVASTVTIAGIAIAMLEPLQNFGFGFSAIAGAVSEFSEAERKIAGEIGVGDRELPVTETHKLLTETVEMPVGLVWLRGKSGAGKTTTMETFLGLRRAGIEAVTTTAYLPQETNLLFANAHENVRFGREISSAQIDSALRCLQLADFATGGHRVDEIIAGDEAAVSGGEARRIVLARTLLSDAQLLLLDEPTTGLDKAARMQVWDMIREHSKTKRVIVVSHDEDAPVMQQDTVINCGI